MEIKPVRMLSFVTVCNNIEYPDIPITGWTVAIVVDNCRKGFPGIRED